MKFLIAIGTVAATASLSTAAVATAGDIGGATPPQQTAAATKPDPNCDQSYANDAPKSGPALKFGVYGRLSGDAGTQQGIPLVAENLDKRDAALAELKGKKKLLVRLNRLFMSQGDAGIAKFVKMADRLGNKGLDVDVALRYHPSSTDNGNIDKWLQFVRKAVRAFGPNKHVVSFEVTNELNVDFSKNTSDGYYKNAVQALAEGVIAAKETSQKYGYTHQKVGFDMFWRSQNGSKDAAVWRKIGKLGGKKLRASTDWVGLHIYPGTWMPGILDSTPITSYKDAFLEGLAQERECFMPLAGFTKSTPIRINEVSYPDGPGRDQAEQTKALEGFLTAANEYRGTYNISNFMYFNLRDNNSSGPSFQSYWGLLKDDYSKKPIFDIYKNFIAQHGAS